MVSVLEDRTFRNFFTASERFISGYGQACGHNPAIPERHKPFGDRFLSLKCVDCSAEDQGSQGFPDVKNWDAENKEKGLYKAI